MRSLCRLLLVWFLSSLVLTAQSVHYSYDELGRLVGVVDQSGAAAQYTYDPNGNILSIARYTASQVALLSFSPTSGTAGTVVTLTGSNFGTDPSSNTVSFNGTPATVQSSSLNQIIAVVPSGTTTGPITVTSPAGTVSSSRPFRINQGRVGVPTITAINPGIGSSGQTITLTGTNFAPETDHNLASLNGIGIPVSSVASSTSLSLIIPSSIGSGHITLQNPFGSVLSSADLYAPPPPLTSSQVLFTQRVTSGVVAPVSISGSGNIGMLLIDAKAGQQASIQVANSTFSGCYSLVLLVLNPDGTPLTSTGMCGSTGFVDSFSIPLSGTYAVVIAPQSGAGSASVSTFLFHDTSGSISLNTSQPVQTTVPGQNARYTFTGTANEAVNVALTGSTFSGCYSNVLSILNPDGSQLASNAVCGASNNVLGDVLLPTAGTYTVMIDPLAAGTGTGSVTLSTDQLGTLAIGSSVPVSIALAGQNGRYTFTGAANQNVDAVLSNSTFSGCYSVVVSILNPDGSQLASNAVCGSSNNDLGSVALPTPGTYTVVVTPLNAGTGTGVANIFSAGPPAATPVFSVAAGTYPASQTVTITDSTSGSTIYYTTDGTVPNAASAQYSSPITISQGTTLNALATAFNYSNSPIATATYVIAVPVISSVSPSSGLPGLPVTISGMHFGQAQGVGTVTINGTAATVNAWSDTTIQATVTAGSSSGNLIVSVQGVQSNAFPFTVLNPANGMRRAITIDHTKVSNSDQSDFPILFSGTYSFLATTPNGGEVNNANGYDIIFTSDAAGQQVLDYEIDSYNPATGAAGFWIRIPTLSHAADTIIYMFYGVPGVTISQEHKAGVWKNNYLSVYHLGNGTNLSTADSGSASYNLSGSTSAVQGMIGGAAGFNGDPGVYLSYQSATAYPTGISPVTLEAWTQFSSSFHGGDILGYGANSYNGSRAGLGFDGSNVQLEFENMAIYGPMTVDTNWHHLVGVYGGGAISSTSDQFYLDGAPLATTVISGTPSMTTTEMKIGGAPTVGFCCSFTGSVDEVRISSGVRSAAWVATEYANQSAASTFYSVGSETNGSGTGHP